MNTTVPDRVVCVHTAGPTVCTWCLPKLVRLQPEEVVAVADGQNWIPQSVDVSVPSSARVYDYVLGGAHNFAVDRQMGDKIERNLPHVRSGARINRA